MEKGQELVEGVQSLEGQVTPERRNHIGEMVTYFTASLIDLVPLLKVGSCRRNFCRSNNNIVVVVVTMWWRGENGVMMMIGVVLLLLVDGGGGGGSCRRKENLTRNQVVCGLWRGGGGDIVHVVGGGVGWDAVG